VGSRTLSERARATVVLKAELLQRTGAFKPRGVLNKLATLSDDEKRRGVISISAGNHAQALAYAAAVEQIDALVVMWETASPMKVVAAREYGATIDTSPPDIPAAFVRLDELIESTGRTPVHPYDDPLVMAGQGAAGPRRRRSCRGRSSWSRARRWPSSSPVGTWRPKRPLLSWPRSEGRHPPRLRAHDGDLLVR